MGIFEWGAVAALVALGTVVWRLATIIQRTSDKANAAEIMSAGANGKVIELERSLAKYKEQVAAEYVSHVAMREVTEAVNRLSERFDNFLMHFIPKQ